MNLPPTLPGIVARAAEEFGNTEALVDERDRCTFVQLQEAAYGAARALVASGIKPGDRVVVDGQLHLQDGATVRTSQSQSDAASLADVEARQ